MKIVAYFILTGLFVYSNSLELLTPQIAILFCCYIFSLISLRKKILNFIFVLFFGLFYIVPFAVKKIVLNEEISPVGFKDLNLGINIYNAYFLIVFIFLTALLLFSFVNSKSSKFQLTFEIKINIQKTLFRVILLFFFSITIYSLLNTITQIQNIGYQNFHLGEGVEKRSYFFVIAQFILNAMFCYGIFKNDKITNITFIVFNIILLFTGMRMPVLVSILVFILYKKPEIITDIKVLLSTFVVIPFVLIFIQMFRYQISIDVENFNDPLFITGIYLQLNEILGYTNELLLATIKIVNEKIYIGNTSPFYDLFSLFDLILQKLTFAPPLTMAQRADSGNFAYQLFRYFLPDAFYYEGATGGGSSLADIYYFFSYIGIILYAYFCIAICNFYTQTLKNKSLLSTILFFNILPLFIRSFRDGYINFLITGFIYSAIAIFILFLISCIKYFNLRTINS